MHTRRAFLAGLAGGALLPAASQVWPTAIGLNGFGSSERVFGKKYELEGILAFAQKEGFDGVEWWPFHGPYPSPADDAAVKALRSKVEAYGLRIFSIQTQPRGASPLHPDPDVRQKYVELLKGQIDLAVKLGGEAAGVWPPPVAAAKDASEDQTEGSRPSNTEGVIIVFRRTGSYKSLRKNRHTSDSPETNK